MRSLICDEQEELEPRKDNMLPTGERKRTLAVLKKKHQK
jgi:hypothetical protein